jgi:hypothetical protein
VEVEIGHLFKVLNHSISGKGRDVDGAGASRYISMFIHRSLHQDARCTRYMNDARCTRYMNDRAAPNTRNGAGSMLRRRFHHPTFQLAAYTETGRLDASMM